jgi:hypothetical protein
MGLGRIGKDRAVPERPRPPGVFKPGGFLFGKKWDGVARSKTLLRRTDIQARLHSIRLSDAYFKRIIRLVSVLPPAVRR